MSLFPAYGGPGGGRGGGGGRGWGRGGNRGGRGGGFGYGHGGGYQQGPPPINYSNDYYPGGGPGRPSSSSSEGGGWGGFGYGGYNNNAGPGRPWSSGGPGGGGGNTPFYIDLGDGSSADPITVNDYGEEEGEVHSPQRSRSSSSRSSKGSKDRHHHHKHKKDHHKRKRSRSRSPSKDRSRKREKRSRSRDRERERSGGGGYNHYENQREVGGPGQGRGQGQWSGYDNRNNSWEGDHGRRQQQQQYGDFNNWDKGRGGGGFPMNRQPGRGEYDNNRGYNREGGRDQSQYYNRGAGHDSNVPQLEFMLDTEANTRNLKQQGLPFNQKSMYRNDWASIKVVGASEEQLSQIYGKFSKFRLLVPEGVTDDLGDDSASTSRPKPKCETQSFIGFQEEEERRRRNNEQNDRIDIRGAFQSSSLPKKDGELSMKENIEMYNKRVREEPHNTDLWKEFVDFQDKYFEENEEIYSTEETSGQRKKKRRNKKALLEKKVAILEKALESNPKNLELQMMRLSFLYTLQPPDFILGEWKKLVGGNQQITAYWIEYFRFAASQLQVFTSPRLTQLVQKSFTKFRQMLSPKFPEFQRPTKFLLVVNDILTCLTLILKNAGFMEKAVSLHQGQIELDFFAPVDQLKSESLMEWQENKKMFEFFWDIGVPRFGEKDAPGWASCVQDIEKCSSLKYSIGVPDSKISQWEDYFFTAVNESTAPPAKSKIWLAMEAYRSKLQWQSWRAKCSDISEIDDNNRIVLGQDISSCIMAIPRLDYITDFSKQSSYFRHVVNFLITLQEDFLPQTQTINALMNPFLSLSLSETRSLASEMFYWRKLLQLYVPENQTAGKEESSSSKEQKKALVEIPEGFRVESWTMPQGHAIKCDKERTLTEFDLEFPVRVSSSIRDLLTENESYASNLVHTVVEKAVDLLDPTFASLLFEMYLRFQQKNTVAVVENRKTRIKTMKTVLQKASIRNSMGAYLELAMLEYAEGNLEQAVSILVKTINLGTTLFKVDEVTGFVDINTDWDKLTELTRLYLRLAELHFCDKPDLAFHILTLLGGGFQPVNLEDVKPPGTNIILKAVRQFEKILNQLVPGIEDEKEGNDDILLPLSKEMLARWDGDKCVDYFAQKSNIIVEWTRAFALFQFLAKEQDFTAASQIYENVLKRIEVTESLKSNGNYDEDIVIRNHIREQLYISWCNLGAHVLSKNPMANSKFRALLGKALQEFPSSPPLLILFTDVENQMSIAGKLWRMMVGIVKQDGGCNHWTPLLMGIGLAKKIEDLERDEELGLDSFGLGGPAVPPDTIFYKLDALLSASQENRLTRSCPIVWRVHLKLLALRTLQGKDHKRAKSTFYDAVRHCPSSKAIYLDGVTYFPDMLKEINELMTEKQLYTRMSQEELDVLLEIENEAQAHSNSNEKSKEELITVSSDDEEA